MGHAIDLWGGRPQDGALQLYTVLSEDKAAQIPHSISFTDGVVFSLALETAVCALHIDRRNPLPDFLPGIFTPALALPYPSLKDSKPAAGNVIVVNGGSSSVGSVTTQLAAAAGLHVSTIVGARDFDLSQRSGASECFDHKHPFLVERMVEAFCRSGQEFVGVVDAISTSDTIAADLEILDHLGGGHLALTNSHMGKEVAPDNVEIGVIWSGGVNEITCPARRAYVGAAPKFGKLRCLPLPSVVGKGLEHIQEVLRLSKSGVSGTELVVDL